MANKNPKNNQRPDRTINRKRGNAPELTPEEENNKLAKQLGLRPKSVAVLDEIISNPNINKTDAYLKHHKTLSRKNASSAVAKLTAKTSARIYSERAVGKAKRRIVQLSDSNNENIALKASQDILDRTEGKAVTKQEITQKTVSVKVDLSGVRVGTHYIRPEQSTPILE